MSRRVRIALLVLGGLVALGLAAIAVVALVVDVDDFRPRIESEARERFGRDVELGELSLSLLPTPAIEVASLRVAGDEDGPWPGEPWVEAGRIRVRASLGALLGGRLEVDGVTLVEPTVRVSRDAEGRWSLEELLPEREPGQQREGGLRLDSVRLDGGRLLLADASLRKGRVLRHELTDLDVRLAGLANDAGRRSVEASATLVSAGGARLSAEGTVGPGRAFDGETTVAGLDLAPIAPFVERWTGMAELAGRLDADLEAERAENGRTEASGTIAVAGLRMPIARPGTRPVDGSAEFDVTVAESGEVSVDSFRIALDETSVEGSGEVTQEDGRQVVRAELKPSRVVVSEVENVAAAFGLEPDLGAVAGSVRVAGRVRATRVADGGGRRLESLAVDGLEIEGARLTVPMGASSSAAPSKAGAKPGDGPEFRARNVTAKDLSVRLVDESGRELLTLADVEATLAAWAPGAEGPIEARASVAGGRVALRGRVGPWTGGDPKLDVTIDASKIQLDALRPLLDGRGFPAPAGGTVSWKSSARGALGGSLVLDGTLTLDDLVLEGEGGRRTVDLSLRHDVAIEDDARRIALRRVALDLPSGPLVLAGSVRRSEGAKPAVEIRTAEAASLTGADVDRLLALAGRDAPFALDTEAPIRVDATVRTGGSGVSLDGRASVERTTLRLRELDVPIQVARANVTLDGDRVRVADAALRLGATDIGGSLTVTGFTSPDVTFDLRSQQAALGELIEHLQAARSRAAARRDDRDGEASLLERTKARGTLAVDRATWKGVEIENLAATVTLRDGRLAFEPLTVATHGGEGSGTIAANLGASPPSFRADGRVAGVNAQTLLSQALGYSDLSGRADATLRLTGRAGSVEQSIRSVEGGGTVALRDGALRGLDVLGALERADAFGEASVARLGSRLAQDGTTFQRLDGDWSLGGGVLQIQRLDATTPDMDVRGSGRVTLLEKRLDLDLRVLFTRELSQQMLDEGSRAARLFWDSRQARVSLPLRLVGPVSQARAVIDWEKAAGQAAREAILGRLGGGSRGDSGADEGSADSPSTEDAAREILGGLIGGGRRTEPAPESSRETTSRETARSEAPQATGPTARIAEARFSGNFLAPDLKISVTLEGRDLERAELRVLGKGGRVLVEERRAFDQEIRGASGGRVEASTRIDADKLLGAAEVTVEVVPVGRDGARGEAARKTVSRTSLF